MMSITAQCKKEKTDLGYNLILVQKAGVDIVHQPFVLNFYCFVYYLVEE